MKKRAFSGIGKSVVGTLIVLTFFFALFACVTLFGQRQSAFNAGAEETAGESGTSAQADADTVKPAAVSEELTYTGEAQNIFTGYDSVRMRAKNITSGLTLNGTAYHATKAGTYSITFALAPNYQWEDGTTEEVTLTKKIERVTLTPSAVIDTKTYDGTTSGTGKITLSGAVNSENPTATGTFEWTNKSADTKTFNVTNIALDSVWTTNYQLSETSLTNQSGTNEIEKKEVSIKWDTTVTFAYDGQAHCPTATAGGLIDGDDCTVTVTVTDGKTGGETDAGKYTATAEGLGNPNYQLPASVTKAFTITKITLTVTASSHTVIYGEEAPSYEITYSGFVNGEDESKLDVAPTPTSAYSSTSNVGSYPVTLSEGEATNYKFSYVSGIVTVKNAKMTDVTANGYSGTYDGTAHSGSVSATTVNQLTYKVRYGTTSDKCSSTAVPEYKDAGEYTVYYQITAPNHNEETGSYKVTIDKKTLTVGGSIYSKVYDGKTTGSGTLTLEGAVNGENPTATGTFEWTDKSVGTKTFKVTNIALRSSFTTNYLSAEEYQGSGDNAITPKTVSIIWGTTTFAYDGQEHCPTATVGGLVSGDTCTVTITGGQKNAGSHTATAEELDNSNYQLEPNSCTFTITQATLTVTASSHTVKYGDEVPTYTVSYDGFVEGENENESLLTKPTVSCAYTSESNVGSYPVTLSGGEATNYNFRYVRGKVTVENAAMTEVSADSYSCDYDGTAHTGSVSATTVNGLAYTVKYGTASGRYSMTDIPMHTDAGDYVVYYRITAPNHTEETGSYTITIKQVKLTVGGIIHAKVYDGKTTGSGSVTLEGAVNGENPTAIGTFVWTSEDAGTKSFNVKKITLAKSFTTNYELSAEEYQGSGDNAITPKTVSIIWGTTTFVYDGQEHCPTATAGGLIGSDACTVTVTGGQKNAGKYTATAEGLGNSNYQLPASVTKAFTITKITLTVTASSHTVTYGDGAPLYTVSYSGFVEGENENNLDTAPTPTSAYSSASSVGSYPVNVSGGVSTNYEFHYVSGKVTVENATMAVTSQGYTGTYNGIAHSGSVDVTTVNDQTFTVRYGTENERFTLSNIPGHTNAGEYTVYYRVTAPNHETVTGSYTVTIGKADIVADGITLEDMRVTFDTQSHFIIAQDVPQALLVKYEENGQTNVGTYTVKAIFTGNSSNYNSFSKTMTATLTIDPAKVEKPEAYTGEFVHNGAEQTYPIDMNPAYKVSGNYQTLAGDYTVTVALVSSNYVWADGTTDDLTFAFKIKSSTLDVPESEGDSMAAIESENGFADNTSLVVNNYPAGKDGVEKYLVEKYGKALKKEIEKGRGKIRYAYEVHLEQNGVTVQPNGKISVKLLIPEELREATYQIIHVHSESEHREVEYSTEGDYVVVEVDSLSDFAFVVNEARTGLGTGAIAGIAVACAVAVALVVFLLIFFLVIKKRKGKKE